MEEPCNKPARRAVALEYILEDYFGVRVEIEQFVGGWYSIDEPSQCALGEESVSSQLGYGAVTGDEMPFTVVFKQGETILTEWLVESKEDGEVQIVETLKSLIDDEDDEGDDED